MKGVHLAIEALALIKQSKPTLTIIGEGPERDPLQKLVQALNLSSQVTFIDTLHYPKPFLQTIENYDFLLLTNLNDEQPRVIFDALARGVLPLCPDNPAYHMLPPPLQYKQGNAQALANLITTLSSQDPCSLITDLRPLLEGHTIESMHRSRADYFLEMVRERK